MLILSAPFPLSTGQSLSSSCNIRGLLASALAALLLAGCAQPPGKAGPLAGLTLQPAAARAAAETPAAAEGVAGPIVVRGGSVRPVLPAEGALPEEGAAVELNVTEAPLKSVVDTVLGDLLKQPYQYDDRVQGTVSLHTGRPLPPREALGLLEAILQSNGAALQRSGGVWRVVPADEAAGGPLAAADAPGAGVSAVPLRHVSAAAMQRLLAGAFPAEQVRAEPGLNLILAVGGAAERRAIAEAARGFDVDWMAGRSVGIYPLADSRPADVIRELQMLFGAGAPNGPGGGPAGAGAAAVSFMPVQRLNAVMVVADSSATLDRAAGWIGRLDHGSGDGRRLAVRPLQHAKATDMARMLTRLFGSGGGGTEPPAGGDIAPPGASLVTLQASPAAAVQPAAAGSGPDAAGLAPVQAEPAHGPAGAGPSGAADPAPAGGSGVRVVADPQRNALLVLGLPEEQRLVEEAIARLDLAPQQVLIEATIAEVSLNDTLRYGVQSFLKNNSGDLQGGFTLGENSLRPVTQLPGFNLLLARGGDPRAVLSALDEVTDVTVVSSPQLVVLDNQTAQLQVGDRVPIITRQAVSTDNPGAPVVNSVEYQDTGVILRVTPRINAGGTVTMDIQQEVSSVSRTTNTGALTPTISRRGISSNVAVRSGQTVALGGLISDQRSGGHSGIPVLARVPVLGALFSERNEGQQRTELIVFITPRVVRTAEDAEAVTRELMGRIRALQPTPPPPGS